MKRRVYIILSIILFGLCSISLTGQEVIVGKVVDKKNNPIPGALITVNGGEYITSSKGDGSFSLPKDITSSKISVEYLGYYRKVLRVSDNKTVKLNKKSNMDLFTSDFFAMFQTALPDIKYDIRPSFGFMAGWHSTVGFYVKGFFQPNEKGSGIKSGDDLDSVWLDGDIYTSYNSLSGGIVVNVFDPICIYAGAGYASRDVIYDVYELGGYYHTGYSYKTVGIDAGILLEFNPIVLSAGATYVPSYGFIGNFGLGIVL